MGRISLRVICIFGQGGGYTCVFGEEATMAANKGRGEDDKKETLAYSGRGQRAEGRGEENKGHI